MRRVEIRRFGGPEVLEVVEAPDPECGPDDVVLEMITSGVNPVDYKMREGNSIWVRPPHHFPVVPGREGYGRVVQVGERASFTVGDLVWGLPDMGWSSGMHAQLVQINARHVVRAPHGIPEAVLGGTPMAALTAWATSFDHGQVTGEDTVLVHGAGGAVGFWIVQLCLRAGANVYASASTRHQEKLRAAGAIPLDYTSGDVLADLPLIDVVLDTVYHDTFDRSLQVLRPGGRIVAVPTLADLTPARERGFEASITSVRPDPERLDQIGDLLVAGEVTTDIAEIVSLADLPRVHTILAEGHAPGKFVVDLRL